MTACPFEAHSTCEPPFERYHIVPKQTIKGQYSYWHGLTVQARQDKGLPTLLPLLEEALLDERNLLTICRRHHELVTNHRISVASGMLPDGIYDWARTVGVVWYLDRWFSEEAAWTDPKRQEPLDTPAEQAGHEKRVSVDELADAIEDVWVRYKSTGRRGHAVDAARFALAFFLGPEPEGVEAASPLLRALAGQEERPVRPPVKLSPDQFAGLAVMSQRLQSFLDGQEGDGRNDV